MKGRRLALLNKVQLVDLSSCDLTDLPSDTRNATTTIIVQYIAKRESQARKWTRLGERDRTPYGSPPVGGQYLYCQLGYSLRSFPPAASHILDVIYLVRRTCRRLVFPIIYVAQSEPAPTIQMSDRRTVRYLTGERWPSWPGGVCDSLARRCALLDELRARDTTQ